MGDTAATSGLKPFPRTTVGGVSMPRMIVGTNWMLGWSHLSPAADQNILSAVRTPETIAGILAVALEHGVDAVMGPLSTQPIAMDGIRRAEERAGRRFILVDTPMPSVEDSPAARREAEAAIKQSASIGATFCLPHQAVTDRLINRHSRTLERIGDYTAMIRDAGMVPGLSTHALETIAYCDENDYDIQTYIQIYNCQGFLMPIEVESIHKTIWKAKKPVMAIKPIAAGRVSPFVGLTFAYATLRDCDMVTVGCMTAQELKEDIEIAHAALERRPPDDRMY